MIRTIKGNKIKVDKIFFTVFIIVYLTLGTEIKLPYKEVLRWCVSLFLLIISLCSKYKYNDRFRILPKRYLLIVLHAILSVFLLDDGLMYGIMRFISFLLVCISLYLYFDRKNMTVDYINEHITLFSMIICIMMCWQLVIYIEQGLPTGSFSGVYANKNMLVSVVIVAEVCSLWIIQCSKSKLQNIGKIFFIINLILIIATGSRAGIICLGYILLMIPFIDKRNLSLDTLLKKSLKICLGMFALYIILKYIDIPALDRIFSESSSDGSTGISRGDLWINAIDILIEKPIFGWGYGSVGYHTFVTNKTQYYWGVHNSFIVILIEGGIVGSILYLTFFMITFKEASNCIIKLKDKQKKIEIIILSILVSVLMINGISESFLFSVGNPVSMCIWMFIILLNKKIELNNKNCKEIYNGTTKGVAISSSRYIKRNS